MIRNIPLPGIDEYDEIFGKSTLAKKVVYRFNIVVNCDEPRFPPRPMCPFCHSL